jgi:hypothetical protein
MTNQHLILSNLKGIHKANFYLRGVDADTYEVLYSKCSGNGDCCDPLNRDQFMILFTSGDGEVGAQEYNIRCWLADGPEYLCRSSYIEFV